MRSLATWSQHWYFVMLVADGKALRMYQGDKSPVVAETEVHWEGLTECHQQKGVGAMLGPESVLGLVVLVVDGEFDKVIPGG